MLEPGFPETQAHKVHKNRKPAAEQSPGTATDQKQSSSGNSLFALISPWQINGRLAYGLYDVHTSHH